MRVKLSGHNAATYPHNAINMGHKHMIISVHLLTLYKKVTFLI